MCTRRFSHRTFRNRRRAAGLSVDEIASMLDKSPWTAIAYDLGRVVPPTNMLPKIAQIFDCTIDELYEQVTP